jgi:hypothetical protein
MLQTLKHNCLYLWMFREGVIWKYDMEKTWMRMPVLNLFQSISGGIMPASKEVTQQHTNKSCADV